jgi:hypothetical protein
MGSRRESIISIFYLIKIHLLMFKLTLSKVFSMRGARVFH